MSLSHKEELVIDIVRDQEMYGLDIVKKSGGKFKRGTVYLTLSGMEERGLLEATVVPSRHEGCLPRRRYRVTDRGMGTFLYRHHPLPTARLVST